MKKTDELLKKISKDSLSNDMNTLHDVFRELVIAMDSIDLDEVHEFIGHEDFIKEKHNFVINKIQSLTAEKKKIDELQGTFYNNSKYVSK